MYRVKAILFHYFFVLETVWRFSFFFFSSLYYGMKNCCSTVVFGILSKYSCNQTPFPPPHWFLFLIFFFLFLKKYLDTRVFLSVGIV